MIFDEDSFPLAASPSLIDLYFLCESGSTVSTIGTRLTTAGTSTLAPHWTAPEIPPGFEPLVAPLPAPTVPPGFLPRATTTIASRAAPIAAPHAAPPTPPAAPCAAPTAPPTVTDGPPPCMWPASPVAYVRRPRQPAPASTTPSFAPFRGRSGCGGACHAPRESTLDDHTGQDWFQGGVWLSCPHCRDFFTNTIPDPVLRSCCTCRSTLACSYGGVRSPDEQLGACSPASGL
jgi:hypothetical protein